MDYSHNYGSNFPNELFQPGTKKDVDDSVSDLVIQYYKYIEEGNVNDAFNLYSDNKNKLEPYIVNMNYVNHLEEEIYNTGLLALNNFSTIISTLEPQHQSTNSYWLQEY